MTVSNSRHRTSAPLLTALCAAIACLAAAPARASSHREAPSITLSPKVDGTDFYMFNSYENARGNFVTLIANYQPLQDPYGGPNYFKMDTNALYAIHIDNNGDARPDISFEFRFQNNFKGITLPIGNQVVPIPLAQAGQVTAPNAAALNVNEKFSVKIVRANGSGRGSDDDEDDGDGRGGRGLSLINAANGSATFDKPSDNIGVKTIPTTLAMPRSTSTPSTSPVVRRQAACSWASGRKPSPSTSV